MSRVLPVLAPTGILFTKPRRYEEKKLPVATCVFNQSPQRTMVIFYNFCFLAISY
uniref:Uncharacterized protein n=1 Tax=Anguilla anguilla TaxID=7936 RepID=A0A0E9SRA1_ANGAN